MHGHKSHDTEVAVPAAVAWAAIRGAELSKFVNKELPHLGTAETVEGNGGVGTVLKIILGPGSPFGGPMLEKITKIDDQNRVSEIDIIEGGFLNKGFSYFRNKVEVVEKGSGSCIIKSSIECEYDENNAEAASLVSVKHLQTMTEAVAKHLEQK